ncbi:MAG TPA: hypothetical protein VJ824_08975 [Bacillota bacterium]|nr:hypothetical protein [Bacillota bacterium]
MDVEMKTDLSGQSPSTEALQNFYQYIVQHILPRMICSLNTNESEK